MFKQAGKLIAKNKNKGPHSDDEEEPRQPNTGGQKRFPPQVRTMNMIYATHIPNRERKRALRDVYVLEPVAPKFNPWSSCLITFDRRDHPTSIRHGGFAALVLDPIIDGFHLARVLMDLRLQPEPALSGHSAQNGYRPLKDQTHKNDL